MPLSNPSNSAFHSPPLEGCPQDGVDAFSHCSQNEVILHPPQDVIANSCPLEKKLQVKKQPDIFVHNIPLKLTPILELPYNPKLKQRAKELRQAGNLPEVLFWMQVTKGRFHKIDFDRQRIIGNYIVDFYVKKLGLIIEIDGSSHIGKEEYDRLREEYLLTLGLTMYRIQVVDIMQRIGMVMTALEDFIVECWSEKIV